MGEALLLRRVVLVLVVWVGEASMDREVGRLIVSTLCLVKDVFGVVSNAIEKMKAVATKGRGFFCDRTSAVVFWDTVLELRTEGGWSVVEF